MKTKKTRMMRFTTQGFKHDIEQVIYKVDVESLRLDNLCAGNGVFVVKDKDGENFFHLKVDDPDIFKRLLYQILERYLK